MSDDKQPDVTKDVVYYDESCYVCSFEISILRKRGEACGIEFINISSADFDNRGRDYDSEMVELDKLIRAYFRNIDPFDDEGQFCDRGNSYKPAIFFDGSLEKKASELAILNASKELKVSPDLIKVDLKPKSKFWVAENYHQDFAEKNELKYKFYRFTCGRDQRLDQVWGDNARTNRIWEE